MGAVYFTSFFFNVSFLFAEREHPSPFNSFIYNNLKSFLLCSDTQKMGGAIFLCSLGGIRQPCVRMMNGEGVFALSTS